MTEPDTDRTAAVEVETRHRLLVARLRSRDERALAELYDELSARIYSLALRIVGRPQVAEEVVEDTFFQVWREAARFDASRGRVIAWVLTIGRSRALDALRRADPALAVEDPDDFRAGEVSGHLDPAVLLEQFEHGSRVRQAMERLPVRERQVVAAAFFRGMTHQEIADAWSMPLGSVKTLLHRAFEMLREQLRGEMEWN